MPDVTNRHREPNGRFADEQHHPRIFNPYNVENDETLAQTQRDIQQGKYDDAIRDDLDAAGVTAFTKKFYEEPVMIALRNYYACQLDRYKHIQEQNADNWATTHLTGAQFANLYEADAVEFTPKYNMTDYKSDHIPLGQETTLTPAFLHRYVDGYDAVKINQDNRAWPQEDRKPENGYFPKYKEIAEWNEESASITEKVQAGIQAEQDAKNHTYITADGVITDAGDMEIAVTNADNTYFNDHPMWNGAIFIKNDWLNKYADKPINDNVRVHVSNTQLGTGHSGEPDTLVFDRLGKGYEPLPDDEKENYINALNRAISINKQKAGK